MKVALIGATGFVGSAILNELLQKGHHIVAIARHPEQLKYSGNVSAVGVDIFDTNALAEAITGMDAVVSAYNAGWTNPDLYNDFLKGSKSIQAAVKQAGVARLLVVGGAGSLFIAPGLQLVDTPQFPAEYKAGATSARDYLNFLKDEKEIDWVFLSPAIEMNPGTSGVKKGSYRSGLENPVFDDNKRCTISVEDLALAIADEIEEPQHHQQRFTVAY